MPLKPVAALAKDTRSGLGEMQHRHFATVAAIIAALPDDMLTRAVADHFADKLAATNPRFDRKRFLAACRH